MSEETFVRLQVDAARFRWKRYYERALGKTIRCAVLYSGPWANSRKDGVGREGFAAGSQWDAPDAVIWDAEVIETPEAELHIAASHESAYPAYSCWRVLTNEPVSGQTLWWVWTVSIHHDGREKRQEGLVIPEEVFAE